MAEPGLELSVDVIVRCPTCMALPDLAQLNAVRRSGVGVFSCLKCSRVNHVNHWIIIQGEFRHRARPVK